MPVARIRVAHRARSPASDTAGSGALPDGRHTRSLVIRMSAKVQETGWYGQVRGVTRWHDDPAKT